MGKLMLASMTAGEVAVAVLTGVGVVFAGLVCIIGLCYLMSFIVNKFDNRKSKKSEDAPAQVASTPSTAIANRQEILAAVCAAVAEEEGTDISAIRVISFKKL